MKTYNSPMLHVVSISKNDSIATSQFAVTNELYQGAVKAPDRFGGDEGYDGD